MTSSTSIRKLPIYRQLSLTCDSPHQKRKSLRKQFSQDIVDFKDPWFEHRDVHITAKNKKNEKNNADRPPVKIAWANNENFSLNDEVIIKKCSKEIKKVSSGKLIRHPSLEKDSILSSKQDLCERLKNNNNNTNEKTEVKPNLQIYLAHNTQENRNLDSQNNSVDNSDQFLIEKSQPKYLQPLVTSQQSFQIKKTSNKKPLESPKAAETMNQKRPNFTRSNTIVVVPLVVEKEKEEVQNNDGINVIIRPMTAQSRREKFQKRTGSAFHGTSKDIQINIRPPLVRSSSAPSTKPEKSKFLASKRKLKSSKKFNSPKDETSKAEVQEWKNAAQTGSEIVTMVSLISPSGSENEDGSEDEKERPKSVLKSVGEKAVKEEIAGKDNTKHFSLRKTVKSVSFQQSSIHAVRSFSASFPARRGSMATALTLGTNGTSTTKTHQEKRGTNPSSPDSDERVPKRRLVRSNTEESKTTAWQRATTQISHIKKATSVKINENVIAVDVHAKTDKNGTAENCPETSMKLNLEENVILITPDVNEKSETQKEEEKPNDEEPTYDTPKEKQCWAMYCKMTEKGINVSYDTILRGMLTPTEYRIRRKTSIAEEMNLLVNPPSSSEDVGPKPTTQEDLMKPKNQI
ncbi:unnamed protein product [Ceutorhynchus assimilis]|uniref:Uncharacterized protein n=1 Tax=Ceutorhynchus assimilis TaxID=467358 RepID=A0A9N9Q9L6_9CUCU|nr:unnamed protein product [Ceutorhynchus assimilis]